MTHTCTQIPREQLVIDRYYVGRGRCGNIGQWQGNHFLVIDGLRVKGEDYYEEEWGCFQPFLEIDEGRTVLPTGTATMWERHYAHVMEFGTDDPNQSPQPDPNNIHRSVE